MITIGCSRMLRNSIRTVSLKRESVDKTLNRLLDVYEDILKEENVSPQGRTNINIKEDTYARLEECKGYPDEPFVHIIGRLVSLEVEKDAD